jgi:hypothetical protein
MIIGAMPHGTMMFFQQSSAPTGWTIQTANTDYTLRVTNGTTGGAFTSGTAFSTVMSNSNTWNNLDMTFNYTTTSNAADLPAHTHTFSGQAETANPYVNNFKPAPNYILGYWSVTGPQVPNAAQVTGGPGGSATPHTHSIGSWFGVADGGPTGFGVNYVDFILCMKN